MIIGKCNHEWEKHTDAGRQIDVGAIPAYYICKKCNALMTAPEVFQLEALENQNETLKHLKGFQSYIAVVAIVISFFALVVAIFK